MRTIFIVIAISLFVVRNVSAQPDLTKEPTDATRSDFELFVESNAPSEDAFVAVQRLAYSTIEARKWDDAVAVFKKYEPKFPAIRDRFETIIKILEAPSEHLRLTNIGAGVNTHREEFSPVLSADGSKLYFTRDNAEDADGYDEDVMVSEYKDSAWQKGEMVGNTIDTKGNESVNGISADGNRILLFGNYDDSYGKGDIFYSDKLPDGSWSKVEHFPRPINTHDFEADGSITSDGKALLFVSDRIGGVGDFHPKGEIFHGDHWGNTDIYVSLKQTDGSWGDPIDLGPVINTPYSERKPFLHPDGKTLYFCSDGHPGLGHFDIFKATRLSDTSWTEWSTPVNLGKEINDGADNFGYRVSTDGSTAYLSLDNRSDGFGLGDIYTMTLTEAAKPAAVATISGKITDESGNPLAVSIKWDDLETGKNIGELSSDPKTGSYFITLPLNKNYGYYADKSGYYPKSNNVDLRGKTESLSHTENIMMTSIKSMQEKEVTVRLNNIFFDFDKATLKSESYPELGRLAEILKKNSNTKVEIGGHTDNKGSHEYNVNLSKKRTQSVVDYLVSQGCNGEMLVAKGYGDSVPIATNDTDEGRAANRRVEVKFIK